VQVLVLNGANLGPARHREPEVYGRTTYAELAELCTRTGAELGLEVEVRQTDAEHELLGWLHDAADRGVPVVLNPAAWSHTPSRCATPAPMLTAPLLEVHISNVHRREAFRATSYVSGVATGVRGSQGYCWPSWLPSTRTLAKRPPRLADG
jgi:3-dehydroquinate dehydratase-2